MGTAAGGPGRPSRRFWKRALYYARRVPDVLVESWRFSSIAVSPLEHVRLCGAALYLRAAWHLPFAPAPPVVATVHHRGRRLRIEMEQFFDFACAWSVLRGGEYDLGFPAEADVIVDLGSNIGVSILDFRARYPQAKIYGVEPNPRAFELLRRNVGDDPRVEIRQVAVAGSDGTADFYAAKDTWASSLSPTRARYDLVQVATRSLDSLLAELGLERVDLLKVDVEGAEGEVFEAFTPLPRIRWIVGELHLNLLGCTHEAFFERHLTGYAIDAHVADGYCTFSAAAQADTGAIGSDPADAGVRSRNRWC
jgi:FkbM family methyltransferase